LAPWNRPHGRPCVLRTRILTAAVVLPPLLAFVIYAPPWVFSLLVGLCTAWGLYEIARMTSAASPGVLLMMAVAGGVPAIVMLGWIRGGIAVLAWPMVIAMCALIVRVELHGAGKAVPAVFLALVGGLYVGTLYPYMALLRNMPGGVGLLLLMLLTVVAGDSGAYFVGRSMGRTKLIPGVSPGKTVEGAIAYVAASVLAAEVLKAPLGVGWSAAAAALFAVLLSIMAQLGDLAESALKRLAGVKDSGWLFPGHGGLLDRGDSLVFAAVFAYYYSRWLGLAAA
jgi:phosphatidate cytidylyltransferase